MINFMQAYAAKNLKGKVSLTVNNSGTDAQKQIAVIGDMISDKVDAILVNPSSDTALDPILEEACKQGILVIAFDQPVTAPCAYVVAVDFTEIGQIHAQWLADTLGGKGNVVINRGVSGFPADTNMNEGMHGVLDKYPDIKVVGEVYGKWDNAVSQQELTKVLTAQPRSTASSTSTAPTARCRRCSTSNRPLVPMSGQGENGWRMAMLDYKDKGLKGVSAGDPAVIGAYALKIAAEILDGKAPADRSSSRYRSRRCRPTISRSVSTSSRTCRRRSTPTRIFPVPISASPSRTASPRTDGRQVPAAGCRISPRRFPARQRESNEVE